ncbi:MAG TPA: aconitase X [Spirochaetota bacterium]|nr:aconitase X [Spirochaetota bacterium]HNT11886.1 aconitase X [Spirochaetota bacterium]
MKLTNPERDILAGAHGSALQKALASVVRFGDVFGADRLVPITGAPHFITSFGAGMIAPYFSMVQSLIDEGLRTQRPFTVDPRPADFDTVRSSLLERIVASLIYNKQAPYERQLAALGLKDAHAFTCACYLPEVGNRPKRGDVLAWSESSAVAFANSVLGARTNRNSAGIDVLCNIVGKAPRFDLLTDAGRTAAWRIDVTTKRLPNAQLLGSAIGRAVMDAVPYITGLREHLGAKLTDPVMDYLKDMGAASASNGAVGLYHVDDLTPEAREHGRSLLAKGHRTYVVDDAELARVFASYPNIWKKPNARPAQCFIGCPHLSLGQLHLWTDRITAALARAGRPALAVETVLCAPPDVHAAFQHDTRAARRLAGAGAKITSLCPLMYLTNPLMKGKAVVTDSNKLRTYTSARFFLEDDLLDIITAGALPSGETRT